MSLVSKLGGFLTGNGDSIAKPIDAVGNAFDKIFTSDEERAAAAVVLEKLKQNPQEWQVALNKIEAGSKSLFKAGWRPFIGWVCGVSLAIYYIPQFALAAFVWGKICLATGQITSYPVTDISGMSQLILGMLGLGTIRTFEKIKGLTK